MMLNVAPFDVVSVVEIRDDSIWTQLITLLCIITYVPAISYKILSQYSESITGGLWIIWGGGASRFG